MCCSYEDLLIPVAKEEILAPMTVIRRIGNGKDQQGLFTRYDNDGGMVLVHVIDPSKGEFLAEAGILSLKRGDRLFRYSDTFKTSPDAKEALSLVREWPLYVKNPQLHDAIESFVCGAYVPSQILAFVAAKTLPLLFVPIQQKFKIGRFEEKVDWKKVRRELFKEALSNMRPGEHITYLAQIPQTQSGYPLFFTAGTKPHYETHMCLLTEPYGFNPSHGGHIQALKSVKGRKRFLVDAGSEYRGKGIRTPLSTAEDVTKALSHTYSGFDYLPVEGRGAFGTDQSY
jgi:hypothetical protein